jgi:2-polyprenyl-3-methyl-5-hydroxy-6-metoxy-1,4-benzoquinol methylase
MRQPLERLMRAHRRATDPLTERALAILADEHPSDTFSRMQWSVGLPWFERRLAAWELSGDACLDFGCGTGNWTFAASRLFARVIGVDTHPQRLRCAQRIREALHISNVRFEPHYTHTAIDTLDCVLFYNVLPYIPNRVEIIRRVVASLRPAGRVVVSFNEIGVCPYYLFGGVRSLERTYIRKALVVPKHFCVERFVRARSVFEASHGWLRTGEVVAFFGRLGFHAVWTSWNAPSSDAIPLFPHRYLCLPFFREIVFQRS